MSKDFKMMSGWCLHWLARGTTPPEWMLRNFHLVDEETEHLKKELVLTEEESNAWLQEIDTAF